MACVDHVLFVVVVVVFFFLFVLINFLLFCLAVTGVWVFIF